MGLGKMTKISIWYQFLRQIATLFSALEFSKIFRGWEKNKNIFSHYLWVLANKNKNLFWNKILF
jgi:hypothetical protein